MGSHVYTAKLTWTGNRGDGTTGYRGFSRDYDIVCEGKPVIKGSSTRTTSAMAERLHETVNAKCFIARSVNFPVYLTSLPSRTHSSPSMATVVSVKKFHRT